MKKQLKVSVLDLVPVREGQQNKEAIEHMTRLIQKVEQYGYERYWIAEHHNMASVVSSATVLLIQQALMHTENIRVGSGGIMLPNHAPLVVAEQFGTLATMYPNRLDLGLGRAPGTDQVTAQALRRSGNDSVYSFPEDIEELLRYFGGASEQKYVRAIPAIGTNVPLYLLGSSTYSAVLAAKMGLPYVFAAHFAPGQLEEAIALYRDRFEPSDYLKEPYVMIGVNAIGAMSDEEAEKQYSTSFRLMYNIRHNIQQPLQPATDNLDEICSPYEQQMMKQASGISLRGTKETLVQQIEAFQEKYAADEIIAVTYVFEEEAQHESYRIVKEAIDTYNEQV